MNPEIQKKIFENSFNTMSEKIFKHCYFRIYDRNRALEITQDVFTKTWDYLRKGNEIKNMQAFIYKTANNLILNEYNRRKIHYSLEELNGDDGLDPPSEENFEEILIENEEKNDVLNKLKSIHPSYREVIYMRYIDEFSVKEIAEILGETENNISVKIHRGLEKLRQLYQHE